MKPSCEDDIDDINDNDNGHQVRSEGPSAAAAAAGDAVAQAEGHGREEHAQPLPQEHGRPHRRDQESISLPQSVSWKMGKPGPVCQKQILELTTRPGLPPSFLKLYLLFGNHT